MNTIHEAFNNSYNTVGRIGEVMVIDYLTYLGFEVNDLENDIKLQRKGQDLIVNGVRIEIKHDRRIADTGNIFAEWSNERPNYIEKGWLQKSQADYLFILSTDNRLYILEMQQLKAIMPQAGRYIRFPNKIDGGYSTAYTLPIAKADKLDLLLHTVDFASQSADDADFFVSILGKVNE